MEPLTPHKKFEPGVFQGTPEDFNSKEIAPPRLIRTMRSDVADAIKNQNETSVSIAIAEEKKKAISRADGGTPQTQTENTPPAPKPIGRIIVIMIVIIVIAALGLAYVFVLPKLGGIKLPTISIPAFPSLSKPRTNGVTATTTESVVQLAPSLIPSQSEKRFNISTQTREKTLDRVADEMKQGVSSGSIKNLYFEEGATAPVSISANRLFIFADISAPEILTRSLEKPFMVGLWGEENWGATPFVILKVSSYDTGFAGMLEWEKTLPDFFGSLFGSKMSNRTSATKFHDLVVLGKDARAIDFPFGGTIAYMFADENTIVITGSVKALETLLPLAPTPTSR